MVLAANPGEVTNGFGGIEYMDELTSSICKNAKENETAQLTDWRDRKSYWVTKLKDGNCWMTQNLDYDGGGTRVDTLSNWKDDNAVAQYYDPGIKVGNGNGSNATSSTDAHTLAGNYYSWLAATNGTGAGISSGDASGSICPSGWKLPTSNNTGSGSFGGLTSGISAGSTLVTSPYYFQYGGIVHSGNLNNAGSQGWYWSSTANNSTNAYNLYFRSGSVNPSDYNSRYAGMPVRCLVQGS